MTDTTNVAGITGAELLQIIEQYESLAAEKKDIADQQKEVMADAKGRGFDTKVLRKLIKLRALPPSSVSEEEAILQLYKEAIGME